MNYSKRTKSISRLLNVGKEDVFMVINVDSKNKKSYIDLSQKNINKNESDECKNRYGKSKQVENIAKQVAVHTNTSLKKIYKQLIWPLYKTHEHALDALKDILAGNTSILDKLNVEDNLKEELIKIIKERLSPQPVKITAEFKLKCSEFEGIEAVKEALSNGVKKGTDKIPIKFCILGSPLYECSLIAINKNEGIEIMKQALDEVKKSIKERNGEFEISKPPKVQGEKEKSLSEQINEAKNKEENEEEEEEEEIEGIKPTKPMFDVDEFNFSKVK